jgi:hypothetical protein
MKGSYVIFHEELSSNNKANSIRNNLTAKMHLQLRESFGLLNSPTVSIKGLCSLHSFLIQHPKFNLYPKVYLEIPSNNLAFTKEPIFGWHYGEVGIWASNYLAWKTLVESEYDFAVILEDDLVIEPIFFDVLTKAIFDLPKNWDVYFHYIENLQNKTVLKPIHNTKFFQPSKCISHAAYVISKQGAKKAINEIENGLSINFPCDWFFLNRPNDYFVYTLSSSTLKGCRIALTPSTFRDTKRYDLTTFLSGI